MAKNKYSKVLTAFFIIIVLSFVSLIGYTGYNFFKKQNQQKESTDMISEFDIQVKENMEIIAQEGEAAEDIDNQDGGQTSNSKTKNSSGKKKSSNTKTAQYKGYNISGKIEIPKIKLVYPILEKLDEQSIEYSVAVLMGPGLNEIGNTVIIGHNYRNGVFFSNLKKVQLNDSIFITDESGKRLEYIIYNKYETTPEDATFLTRQTAGKREITLQTCTDNVQNRLIVWAKEK